MLNSLSIFKKQIFQRHNKARVDCSRERNNKIFFSYRLRNEGENFKNRKAFIHDNSKKQSPLNNIRSESITDSKYINNKVKEHQYQYTDRKNNSIQRHRLKLNVVSFHDSYIPRSRSTFDSPIKSRKSNNQNLDLKIKIIGKLFGS